MPPAYSSRGPKCDVGSVSEAQGEGPTCEAYGSARPCMPILLTSKKSQKLDVYTITHGFQMIHLILKESEPTVPAPRHTGRSIYWCTLIQAGTGDIETQGKAPSLPGAASYQGRGHARGTQRALGWLGRWPCWDQGKQGGRTRGRQGRSPAPGSLGVCQALHSRLR